VLYKRMHADVLECCCFIYETLKRRAGSYDEKRKSHEAWIMVSVRNMVREWLKSKKGQGKSPYETGESDLAGVDGAGGSFSGIRASLLAATADPSEELVASEDNKRFYEELGRALDEKSCRLLDLLDLQGLPMLAVARRLGYQAPSEQTALDLARLLIADRFTDTAKLIVLYHLSPCGKESPGDFVKRVELRMAQVSVLATRVEARAALAGIAPRELLSEAARVLSGGRLRPAAEALTRAGMAPLRGETVEQFSKRIHYARGGLGDADAQLEKLDDNKLAARVRREVCDLHKECRRLVEQNPELDALARAIMKRISQSGPDAPEVLPNKDHNDLFQEEERSPGENRKKEHQNNEESKGAA
jgi:RNA polymerase sigma factor (sigma-70 family)